MNRKATTIKLFSFRTPQMRAFHMSWLAFFLCFFGWFAFPALSQVIIEQLGITRSQFVTTSQWAVGSTILMRLFMGWLCDRIGPRLTYTWLLILGAIPVALAGFIQNYEQLLFARICIGAIGAGFVITQYHSSAMFAGNIVGTANATTAGWGNLGGGVTQKAMPLLLLAMAFMGEDAWRYALALPAVAMVIMGIAYYFLTQDTPEGNYSDLRKSKTDKPKGLFLEVIKDYRVWLLTIIYGACFGMELIMNSQLVLYFMSDFKMDLQTAGLIAAIFGLMNIFARTSGGFLGDKFGKLNGLKGRVHWLFIVLFVEGIMLMFFSRATSIGSLIPLLIGFSLFVQMSSGATFSVVPFINKRALGPVAGLVGAGGNAGAVLGMFLFKIDGLSWGDAFFTLGMIVMGISFLSLGIRFGKEAKEQAQMEIERKGLSPGAA